MGGFMTLYTIKAYIIGGDKISVVENMSFSKQATHKWKLKRQKEE